MDDEEDQEGVASRRSRTETGSDGSTCETPPPTQVRRTLRSWFNNVEVTGAPDGGHGGRSRGGESPPGVGLRENVPEGLQTASRANFVEKNCSQRGAKIGPGEHVGGEEGCWFALFS